MLKSITFITILASTINAYSQEVPRLTDLIEPLKSIFECEDDNPSIESHNLAPQVIPSFLLEQGILLQKQAQEILNKQEKKSFLLSQKKHCQAIHYHVEAIKALKKQFHKNINKIPFSKNINKTTILNYSSEEENAAIFPNDLTIENILSNKKASHIYKEALLKASLSAQKIGAFKDSSKLLLHYYKVFSTFEPKKSANALIGSVKNSLQQYRGVKRTIHYLDDAYEIIRLLERDFEGTDFYKKDVYPLLLFVSNELANRDLSVAMFNCNVANPKEKPLSEFFSSLSTKESDPANHYIACRMRLETVIKNYSYSKAAPEALYWYVKMHHDISQKLKNPKPSPNLNLKNLKARFPTVEINKNITQALDILTKGLSSEKEQNRKQLIKCYLDKSMGVLENQDTKKCDSALKKYQQSFSKKFEEFYLD